jgi:hypothetical protein
MEITERDLFNYVFYKNLIEKEKIEYLENSVIYKSEIDFLTSIKNALSEELTDETKEKISRKIPAYQN